MEKEWNGGDKDDTNDNKSNTTYEATRKPTLKPPNKLSGFDPSGQRSYLLTEKAAKAIDNSPVKEVSFKMSPKTKKDNVANKDSKPVLLLTPS